MGDLVQEGLTPIRGTSIIAELSDAMIEHARKCFWAENVEVDLYFNELSATNLERLHSRAERATQVLWKMFNVEIDPEQNQDKSKRTQKERDSIGFYVVYSDSYEDEGSKQKAINAFKVIDRLRKIFSSFKITLTVDEKGNQNEFGLRCISVDDGQTLPFVIFYRVVWEVSPIRDMKIPTYSKPAAPLATGFLLDGSNTLTWIASESPWISGYKILRSTVDGGPYEEVGTVSGKDTTQWVEKQPPSVTSYYVIRAVNENEEKESDDSFQITIDF